MPMAPPIPFACNIAMDRLFDVLVRRLVVGNTAEADPDLERRADSDCLSGMIEAAW